MRLKSVLHRFDAADCKNRRHCEARQGRGNLLVLGY